MKCPKCGLLNAATAERCDCGYGFADGSVSQPTAAVIPGARLKRGGCAVAVVAFLTAVVVRRASEASGVLLLGVAGDVLMVIVFLASAAWVIGSLRMRKGPN